IVQWTLLSRVADTLDIGPPVSMLHLTYLHFLADDAYPAESVAEFTRALAPGSYLFISHLTADLDPGQVGAAVEAYNAAVPGGVIPRSHAEVTALFGGLPLVPPGVVPLTEWRPTSATGPAACADLYAGIPP